VRGQITDGAGSWSGGYQRVDIPVVRDWLLCTLGPDPVANCPSLGSDD
jgi:hypothetical protein